jgi:uncharacterized membrane protein YbhN (UPF0104 family)
VAATAAVLGFGSVWIRNHWSSLIDLFRLQPACLAGMALVTVLLIGVMSWMNQMAAAYLGAQLAFSRWVATTVAGSLMNLVLPLQAGMPLRAAYLRKRAHLSLPHFASVLAGITVISIIVTAALGLAAIPWTGMAGRPAGGVLGCVLAAVLVATIAVALVPSSRWSRRKPASRWIAAIYAAHHGWYQIRRSRILLLRIAAVCLLQTSLAAGRLLLAYQAVGHGCSLPAAVLLTVLASLSTLVSITPAGLGVREAVLAAGEAASGGDPAVGLLAAMADRVVGTVVIAVLGPVAFSILLADLARSDRPAD